MHCIFKKVTSAALAAAMIFLLGSCAINAKKGQGEEIDCRLVIEDTFKPYTEQQKQQIASSLLEAISAVMTENWELDPSDQQLEKFVQYIYDDIIPIFEKNKVTPLQVVQCAQNVMILHSPIGLYRQTVLLVGNYGAGEILYAAACTWLEIKAERCLEQHENNGQESHLVDAQRYERQLYELEEELGKEAFCSSAGFLLSLVPEFSGISSLGGGIQGILLGSDGGVILSVLRKQAYQISSLPLTAEQWGICSEIVSELMIYDVFEKSLSGLNLDECKALTHGGEVARSIGECMPQILSLYSAMARNIKPTDMEELLSDEYHERMAAWCKTVSLCEAEFMSLVEKLEMLDLFTDAEAALIENGEYSQEYAEYAAKRARINARELFEYICAGADISADQERLDLVQRIEDFSFSVAPYATFVFWEKNRES